MITPVDYAQQVGQGHRTAATGPRTTEGKAASSRNAVKHGLTGTTFALLPGEDVAAFEALTHDYKAEWKPATAHETFLVNHMVQARWKLDRIARMEAEWYNDILNVPNAEGRSDEEALVYMAPVRGQEIEKLQRYARETERAYFRAVRELRAYRAQRADEAKKRNEPVALAATATAEPMSRDRQGAASAACAASPAAAAVTLDRVEASRHGEPVGAHQIQRSPASPSICISRGMPGRASA